MKKIFIIIMALIFLLSGCNTQTNVDTPSEVPSEDPSQREESKIIPEDIYDFLSSKYYVTARNESMGNIYEYVFYFDEGVVVGTKTVSTLTSEKLAESYAESLKNDDAPCVFLEGNTVTAYKTYYELTVILEGYLHDIYHFTRRNNNNWTDLYWRDAKKQCQDQKTTSQKVNHGTRTKLGLLWGVYFQLNNHVFPRLHLKYYTLWFIVRRLLSRQE